MTREKAIELIKDAMPTLWKETKVAIQTLIPELEENEDEKIRKSLIKDFRNYYEMYDKSCGEPKWGSDCLLVKDILDWLERRKEQKTASVIRIPKFRVGDIIQHVPLEKWDRSARVRAIDENGYSIDYTHIGDSVSGGYVGFSFENEYELVEQQPVGWSEEDKKTINEILSFFRKMAHGETIVTDTTDATRWHNWLLGNSGGQDVPIYVKMALNEVCEAMQRWDNELNARKEE